MAADELVLSGAAEPAHAVELPGTTEPVVVAIGVCLEVQPASIGV